MKILKLESENIKRLHAVEIHPSGELVVIGGRNGQGKTSVLDSIQYALGGKRSIPEQTIHKGEESAHIVCELDDLIVKRTFKADGRTNLTVENRDGAVHKSPQAILDKLVGDLSFDPLEFMRKDSSEQIGILCKLIGVDFSDQDKKREQHYEDRKLANKEVKRLATLLEDMEAFDGLPINEVSASDLITELADAKEVHRQYDEKIIQTQKNMGAIRKLQESIERKKAELKEMIDKSIKAITKLEENEKALKTELQQLPDTESINDRLQTIEETNRQIRHNRDRENLKKTLEINQTKATEHTEAIEAIDKGKAELIAASNLPVEGLSFDEDGVLFNGIPFDKDHTSSAEMLRVSLAMGIAMNPQLRVLLIRDGSLLDEDNLGFIARMADAHDCQVWIERVGTGDEISVIIEDGSIK